MTEEHSKVPEGILRDLRIFISASGTNSMFGVYAFTYRVIDAHGETILSNVNEPVEIISGTTDQGHHAALLYIIPRIRPAILDRVTGWLKAGGTLETLQAELFEKRQVTVITSKGDAVFRAYTHTPEDLLATGFKQKSGHLWANAAYIARALAEAEELGFVLTCRHSQTIQEDALLELTRSEGKRRWIAGQKELKQRFQ
jgi:hypothetical protein